jgi:hypothetical protein
MSDERISILVEAIDKASGVLGDIGGALSSLGGVALGVAAGGIAAFGAAVVSGMGDAKESALLLAQTESAITSTGSAAGIAAQHVTDLASSLSDAAGASLFGDDQVQQSENLLLTFTNIKGAVFDAATAVSVDMAQALGGAPKDSAIQLGKALNDPIQGISALSRVGVSFTEEQKAQIAAMQKAGDMAGAQGVILAELNKEFGGSAKAAAGATGGWSEFTGRLGEAKEALGAAVLPLLNLLAGVLNDKVLPIVELGAQKFGDLIAAFQTGAEGGDFLGGIINALYSLDSISPVFDTIGDAIASIADAFSEAGPLSSEFGEAIGGIASQLGLSAPMVDLFEQGIFALQGAIGQIADGGLQALIGMISRVSPGLQLLVGVVGAALPILGQVGGILAGAAAQAGGFSGIIGTLSGVWQALYGTIQAIIPAILAVVTAVFGQIGAFLSAHGAEISAFLASAWQQIAQIITTAAQLIAAIVVPIFQGIAGFITAHGEQIQAVLTAAWQVISGVIQGALTLIQGIITAALQVVQGDWSGAWVTIQSMSASFVASLLQVIQGGLQLILGAFGLLVDGALSALGGLVAAVPGVGGDIVRGIISGVQGAAGSLFATLTNLAMGALQAARNALRMQSPSLVFAELVGAPIVGGIMQGIFTAMPDLRAAFFRLRDNALQPLEGLAGLARDMIGKALDSSVSRTRGALGNFDALNDLAENGLSPQALSQARAALASAQADAAKLAQTNAQAGADYLKLKSDQILELAQLARDQQDAEEAGDQDKAAQLQQRLVLVKAAQAAELAQFQQHADDMQNTQRGAIVNLLEQSRQAKDRSAMNILLAGLSALGIDMPALESAPRRPDGRIQPGYVQPQAIAFHEGAIVINGAPGQDINALADQVLRKLNDKIASRR